MLKYLYLLFLFSLLLACSDNEKLQPLAADATILAFGDSLTYGTGTSPDNAYPAVLAQLINRKVINAGISGEVSSQGLLRLPGLIDQHQPDLVILCHGANDILRKLDLNKASHNIQRMIDLAVKNNAQVILIGVPEFGLFLDTSPIYQVLAEKNDIPIELDVLGDIIGDNTLKSDYIHPNAKGYRVLAEKVSLLLEETGAISIK